MTIGIADTAVAVSSGNPREHQQARDKRPDIDYMSRMIHLTASFWYFSYGSSLAVGGLRSI
ncbi:hypothetical protein MPL3356_30169 [Mesorhizobium plurifarium]|uniref:Uncharacterized protein n=1 Tax=Mesorhizobium plurifarium TaxID=69974 RepID=A0A090DRU8_MESPL|nr:hypothetical protein MPL3356_30169 [Mesorhizobium plurifarium]